jgi:hypothetical protein
MCMCVQLNPGNNILPVMPALQQVFDDPVVRGALTGLLGEQYVMHAHRFPHPSFPGRKEQQWHKDSYFGFQETRAHRPNWLMCVVLCTHGVCPALPCPLCCEVLPHFSFVRFVCCFDVH